MNKEVDLSEQRMSAKSEVVDLQERETFEHDMVPEVSRQLESVVLDYNFDTFSFMGELIEISQTQGVPLSETFSQWNIDSPTLAEKHLGSNCTGLSLRLKQNLAQAGVPTFLVPSYGDYLLTKSADRYAEIRTMDLVGIVQMDEGSRSPVFLAPGLTVEKPMFLRKGYQVESFGSRYVITDVSDEEFNILRINPEGETRERVFHFKEVANPEESLQKNLLRARTRYQLTRQYADGKKDFVTFDFPMRSFRVSLGGELSTMSPGEFRNYLAVNSQRLQDIFRSPEVVSTLGRFTDSINLIKRELLLPDIQNILEKTWRSS